MKLIKFLEDAKLAEHVKEDLKSYLQEEAKPLCDKLEYFNGHLPFMCLLRRTNKIFGEKIYFAKEKIEGRIIQTRKDRLPVDTPLHLHNMINEYFHQHFKVKARAEATFCSGLDSDIDADYSEFGHQKLIIFPFGKFQYIWSENVKDLFLEIRRFSKLNDVLKHFVMGPSTPEDIKIVRESLFNYLDKLQYKDTDLQKAAEVNREIMIFCDKYLAISYSDSDELKMIRKYLI